MNESPYEDARGVGGPGAQGPIADWLREAATPRAPWGPPPQPSQPPWPARFDLDPPRERLTAMGALPWVVAGLLVAFLLVGRAPAAPPPPTPVSATVAPAPVDACGQVAP
jgi:hypothetical protein